MKTKANLAQLA